MELVSKVRGNAWLFLRRAIKELVNHDDSNDDGLTEEAATISTTFIQIAFELSLVAYFINKYGIHGIVKGSESSLTEEEILAKFESNDLNTKTFNTLKKQAVDSHIFLNNEDECLIDNFQMVRNKLVHLNYKFDIDELYDFKYDLTYFIVKVIIPVLSGECERPSEAIYKNLDSKDFVKLIKFPPYAYEMYKAAKLQSAFVYKCVHCENESLAVDYGNEHCYSCCSDFTGAGFIDCPYCKSRSSMIYDALNIDEQGDFTIKGLCLKCKKNDMVYHCQKCNDKIALEACTGNKKCYFGHCEWDD